MSNVHDLGLEKIFPVEGELMQRLTELIEEYDGRISTSSVLGVLQLKSQCIVISQLEIE